jgi:hypothetical protein
MVEPTGPNPNPFAEDIEAAVAPLTEAPIETGFCVPADVLVALGEGDIIRGSAFLHSLWTAQQWVESRFASACQAPYCSGGTPTLSMPWRPRSTSAARSRPMIWPRYLPPP